MKLRYTMLIIMLPLLALVGYFLFAEYRFLSGGEARAKATAEAAQETTELYTVISQVQRERGLSVGAISSDGKNFKPELAKQRQAVNAAIAAMPPEFNELSAAAPEQIRAFLDGIEKFTTWHARVDSGAITVNEVVELCSATVDAGLQATAQRLVGGETETLTALSQARSMLALAKEYAGQERSGVLAVIVSGTISKEIVERIVYFRAMPEFAIRRAADVLGDDALARRLLADPAASSIGKSREIVLDAAFGGPLANLTGSEWFAGALAWLAAIAAVEDLLGDRLCSLSLKVAD